jgi:hypothetical protein
MAGSLAMHLSPRCGAHARTTGRPCENAAMLNGRCRLHGGRNPGAPQDNCNAVTNGSRMRETQISAQAGAALGRISRAMVRNVEAQWKGKTPRGVGKECHDVLVKEAVTLQLVQEEAAKQKADRLAKHFADTPASPAATTRSPGRKRKRETTSADDT